MLRRRPDNTFEFREIERALYSIQPPALSTERKDLLRARIMESLGEQDALHQAGILTPFFRERWVAVPAGIGIAAAIIAGIKGYDTIIVGSGSGDQPTFAGQLSVGGEPVNAIRPGPTFTAAVHTNVHLGNEVVVMLEQGASFRYAVSDGRVTVYPVDGKTTVVTGKNPTDVLGDRWSARVSVESAALFVLADGWVTVRGDGGVVSVTDLHGAQQAITTGGTVTFDTRGEPSPAGQVPADPFDGNMGGPSQAGPSSNSGAPAGESQDDDDGSAPGASPAPGPNKPVPAAPNVPPAQGGTPPATSNADPGSPPAAPPEHVAEDEVPPAEPPADPKGPPEEVPAPIVPPGHGGESPADPPGGGQPEDPGSQGNGEPPSSPPGQDGGEPGSNGQGNGNANGPGANSSENGNGPGSSNGNGPESNTGNGQGSNNGNGSGSNNGNGNGNQVLASDLTEDGEGSTGAEPAAPGQNGQGNAYGHSHSPGQQDNHGNGKGGGTSGNGSAGAANPGRGNGTALYKMP